MPHRYLSELITPAVAAAQERYGSRVSMGRLTAGWHTDGRLGPDEAEFIGERDGFYLGTVGETGWPYVQHRGGPPGFLHVLDDLDLGGVPGGPATAASPDAPSAPDDPAPADAERSSVLAWPDFRGNRQYLSVGNLGASSRVSLFLMDYAAQRRLKILGTARVLDARDGQAGAALAERLAAPGYDARIERVVTVDVHSYDWNCPQHITPRWSEAELEPALEPLRAELDRLRKENLRLGEQVRASR